MTLADAGITAEMARMRTSAGVGDYTDAIGFMVADGYPPRNRATSSARPEMAVRRFRESQTLPLTERNPAAMPPSPGLPASAAHPGSPP